MATCPAHGWVTKPNDQLYSLSYYMPTGVAHYSMKDDEYEGFFIPKGSIGKSDT